MLQRTEYYLTTHQIYDDENGAIPAGVGERAHFTELFMSRILVTLFAVAAMAPVTTSAIAQDTVTTSAAVTPKVGQVVRDAKGRRLAAIESIKDGNVFVIMDMRMFRIPTSTLSLGDKGLQTSLSRSDLR
jgi:hypothetical protein